MPRDGAVRVAWTVHVQGPGRYMYRVLLLVPAPGPTLLVMAGPTLLVMARHAPV